MSFASKLPAPDSNIENKAIFESSRHFTTSDIDLFAWKWFFSRVPMVESWLRVFRHVLVPYIFLDFHPISRYVAKIAIFESSRHFTFPDIDLFRWKWFFCRVTMCKSWLRVMRPCGMPSSRCHLPPNYQPPIQIYNFWKFPPIYAPGIWFGMGIDHFFESLVI